MTACTQPGCTGTILDGYCDVCGSPAAAVPFVLAGTAALAASATFANEPGPTAAAAPIPASAHVDEEIPTLRILRVKVPTQQLSTDDMADPGAANASAVAEEIPTLRIPRVKAPTQQFSTFEMADQAAADHPALDAQDYRTRVEGAELPDHVREVALCEVGKLERTSDQSPDAGDIRTWLDTILDLPWSTKSTDWIDIEGSHEVEATLRRLIEPAAGDIEEGDAAEVEATLRRLIEPPAGDIEESDTAEVEAVIGDVEEGDIAEVDPAIADTEKADRAPADPYDDDTVETPAVLAGLSGRPHLGPQFPEQQLVGPVLVENPPEKRRFRSLALAATALAALLIGAVFFGASRDGSVTAQSAPTVTATATATATASATVSKSTSEPSNQSTNSGGGESTIQLEDLTDSARPFEAVRIQGTYRGGEGNFLLVQRWEGGKWLDFPLPTKIDQSGLFITQAEFGRPGRYRLRVLDPDSGVASKPFVVVIKG